jgi:X-X-X-Leu-X-X-Gly heptad repeat protein
VQTFHEQVAELVDGASELADGIAELNKSISEELTKSLGNEKQELVSFADARNADPATQIFLLRTVAVRMPEIEEAAANKRGPRSGSGSWRCLKKAKTFT